MTLLVPTNIPKRRRRSTEARVIMPDGTRQPVDAVVYGGGNSGYSGAAASSNRGYIIFPQLDTRREVSKWTRTEMLRRSRWLCANVGFAKRLVFGISRLMGALHPDPHTKDTAWKKEALAYFWSVADAPLLFSRSGKFTFASYQRFLSRRWLVDGDVATVLTRGRTGQTMVAPYEAHQIQHDVDSAKWFDGVRVDGGNRLQEISLYDFEADKYHRFSADQVVLTAHWERAGQPRGVTPFHAALTRLMDVREVTGDMMGNIKRSGLLGFYLASQPGAPSLGDDGLAGGMQAHLADIISGQMSQGTDATTDNPALPSKKKVMIEDLTAGSIIPELPGGMEPKVLHDSRPASEQMSLLSWFIRECTLSFDFHPEILWDLASLNGNTSRLAKEDAESAVSHYRGEILKPFCQRYWFALIGNAIATGRLRAPADGGRWDEVEWISPRKMTIDRGNEGRLALEERRQPGMRTLATHYGEQQRNWEAEADQWLDEIDYFTGSALARGWSPARIVALESLLLAPPAGAGLAMMGDPATVGITPPGPDPEEFPSGLGV